MTQDHYVLQLKSSYEETSRKSQNTHHALGIQRLLKYIMELLGAPGSHENNNEAHKTKSDSLWPPGNIRNCEKMVPLRWKKSGPVVFVQNQQWAPEQQTVTQNFQGSN